MGLVLLFLLRLLSGLRFLGLLSSSVGRVLLSHLLVGGLEELQRLLLKGVDGLLDRRRLLRVLVGEDAADFFDLLLQGSRLSRNSQIEDGRTSSAGSWSAYSVILVSVS